MFQEKSQFQARSGRTVRVGDDGSLMFDRVNGYIGADSAMDAEEYFQAKSDVDLGRWRWPEDPGFVVYQRYEDGHDLATVFRESDGTQATYDRNDFPTGESDRWFGHRDAAGAFFRVHRERKPWHDAKPGEVWLLTIDGAESAFYPSKSLYRAFTPVAPETGRTAIVMNSFEIASARRIWPEDAS